MATALIALGSNLGNRQRNLDDAVAQLGNTPNVVVLATSRWRETKPVGGPADQGEFLNGAALLGTSLTPQQLHAVLEQIEKAAGRTREGRWAPRTLDLDLLLYDDLVLDTPELKLPHPRMSFRRFVLEPAAEIAPDMRHPTIGWTIAALRDHLLGAGPKYIAAVTGPIAAGKSTLVNTVANELKLLPVTESVLFTMLERSHARQALRRSDHRSLAAAKEWLGWQCRPLTKCLGPADVISDYWLDQELCLAEMTLPTDELAEYVSFYHSIASFAKTARLLVMVDIPPDESWQRIALEGDHNPPSLDWLSRHRELLRKRVGQPGRGPVLRLDGTKLDEAKDELVAAIQAMQ
jgi:2-amino-4-hydroxy-6-hydroxymethyldihydropteridine diphosphokinase